MKLHITFLLTLSLLAPASAIVFAPSGALFDPDDVTFLVNDSNAFAPASGNVVFDTDNLVATHNGNLIGTGEQGFDQSSTDFAVFAFSDIALSSSINVSITGSRPVALLSQTNFSLCLLYTSPSPRDRG